MHYILVCYRAINVFIIVCSSIKIVMLYQDILYAYSYRDNDL